VLLDACQDDINVCPFLAATGLCGGGSLWVETQCARSCGQCASAAAAQPTAAAKTQTQKAGGFHSLGPLRGIPCVNLYQQHSDTQLEPTSKHSGLLVDALGSLASCRGLESTSAGFVGMGVVTDTRAADMGYGLRPGTARG
jgi:hypothetical protein